MRATRTPMMPYGPRIAPSLPTRAPRPRPGGPVRLAQHQVYGTPHHTPACQTSPGTREGRARATRPRWCRAATRCAGQGHWGAGASPALCCAFFRSGATHQAAPISTATRVAIPQAAPGWCRTSAMTSCVARIRARESGTRPATIRRLACSLNRSRSGRGRWIRCWAAGAANRTRLVTEQRKVAR